MPFADSGDNWHALRIIRTGFLLRVHLDSTIYEKSESLVRNAQFYLSALSAIEHIRIIFYPFVSSSFAHSAHFFPLNQIEQNFAKFCKNKLT